MKRFAFTLAVLSILLFASSVQASAVGTKFTYDFNSLTTDANLDQNSDALVKWVALPEGGTSSNQGAGFKVHTVYNDSVNPDLEAYAYAQKNERDLAKPQPGVSPIDFDSSDAGKVFMITYTGKMDVNAAELVGVWVDLDGNGTMANSDTEILAQFGISSSKWRVRGPGGSPSTNSDTNVPAAGSLHLITLELLVNLSALDGNGSMTLYVNDITAQTEYVPYRNLTMNLKAVDAKFSDPNNWLSWTIRGQEPAGYDANYPMTADDFTIELLPEPATLSLLVLGGLACIRRRR